MTAANPAAFDWQPRYLVIKTGSFTSRSHDRFAFFSLRRCCLVGARSSCRGSAKLAIRFASVYVSLDRDSRACVSVAARSATRAIRGASTTTNKIAETRAASRHEGAQRCSLVSCECTRATRAWLRVASRRHLLASITRARSCAECSALRALRGYSSDGSPYGVVMISNRWPLGSSK